MPQDAIERSLLSDGLVRRYDSSGVDGRPGAVDDVVDRLTGDGENDRRHHHGHDPDGHIDVWKDLTEVRIARR
jgi:hypothetical protein